MAQSSGFGVLLLAAATLTTTAGVTTATTTCSLDLPPSWSCPAQPSDLTLVFSEVSVSECGQRYSKTIFKTLENLKTNAPLDEGNKTYTAVMVDPDAPGHTDGKAWLHWIHSGLTAENFAAGTLKGGQEIVAYRPPTPPQGTGIHRYFVFVFEETQPVQPEELKGRRGFDLTAYATRQLLCGPVASQMFQTQF